MDKQKLWQTVLGEIELSVSEGVFITWFKKTELVDIDTGCAIVSVPNIFAKQQFEAKFNQLVHSTLEKNGVSVDEINYTISGSKQKIKPRDEETVSVTRRSDDTTVPSTTPTGTLNPRYTLANFIVGSSNELAYTACQSISKAPGEKYNPLFLYGGVGLGKTHLMQAVGNEILSNNPAARVLYVSTETFVNEFVDSLRLKRPGFSERYRNIDVLIVDDIQFIAGKEKTQDEFFHTFNTLHQANKQIIISSDRQPRDIPTLTDRLRSRFAWGMAIDIQMPDFETRCAIIEAKASMVGADLNKETIEYLAENIKTNIRELEGALNQLLAYCEMRGIKPDTQTASGLIGNVRQSRPQHLSPRQIVERTARHFQIESRDITSPKRDKHIVVPRQIAMYLLRSELHMSFPRIAVELGRKDHTTAIHSVEKIEKAIKLDYMIRQHVAEIRERLYV